MIRRWRKFIRRNKQTEHSQEPVRQPGERTVGLIYQDRLRVPHYIPYKGRHQEEP